MTSVLVSGLMVIGVLTDVAIFSNVYALLKIEEGHLIATFNSSGCVIQCVVCKQL